MGAFLWERVKTTFGWTPRWNLDMAVQKVVEWTKVYLDGGDVSSCMYDQIDEFMDGGNTL